MTFNEELEAQRTIYEALRSAPKETQDRVLRNVVDALARTNRQSRVLKWPSQPNPEVLEEIALGLPDDAA